MKPPKETEAGHSFEMVKQNLENEKHNNRRIDGEITVERRFSADSHLIQGVRLGRSWGPAGIIDHGRVQRSGRSQIFNLYGYTEW